MPKNTDVKRTAKSSPNLDLESQITSQNGKCLSVKGIKYSCKKSWCRRCGIKATIKRFVAKMINWDWRYVRQIVLTVDHKQYESPEQALKTINGKRHIAGLVHNLERTKGIKVIDWQWVIEWYKNGYPHWHLFLLVDKTGKAGRIGFKNIVQYWNSGWIKESYIKNENHWKQLTGYFEKHGYFDGKKMHQSRLPEWARAKEYVIRRTGGKVQGTNKNNSNRERYLKREERRIKNPKLHEDLTSLELGIWFSQQSSTNNEITQGEMLDQCGSQTDIYIGYGFTNCFRIDMPYKEFRSLDGEYQEGIGYVVEMDGVQFEIFRAKYLMFHDP